MAALVGENLYDLIPGDADRDILRGPLGLAVLGTLLKNNLLGAKSGQGFYKTVRDGQGRRSFWGLDLQAAAEGGLDYVEPCSPQLGKRRRSEGRAAARTPAPSGRLTCRRR